MAKIEFLDTTLRDGAQAVGISFSTADKTGILNLLDDFGMDLIEGGDPASNPKDSEFFINTSNPKLCAFGSTRHRDSDTAKDVGLNKLIEANTKTVCIFGKASAKQARKVLGVTPEQNLDMIRQSVRFLREHQKRVIFDAEHFFDGYAEDKTYAFSVLLAAQDAGADTLVLCDTNGGTMPSKVYAVTSDVVHNFGSCRIGIHTHNDCGMAVANSIMAADAGATHVQGTFLGFGERCGNANLSTIIADLALKSHVQTNCKIERLTATARAIAEIANLTLDTSMPFVGSGAFAHKAGMHADAVIKDAESFEHILPQSVGNSHGIVLSEVSGRSAVAKKLEHVFPSLDKCDPKTQEILDAIKNMEKQGYQFEGADGSFILLAQRMINGVSPSFELEYYRISAQKPSDDSNAEVCIKVNGTTTTVNESGNGPVNALDKALRTALRHHFPSIAEVSLVDYKVRVVDSTSATGALVRVLITSSDRLHTWTTVGVSTDIIEASWIALRDSLEYKLKVLGGK